MRARQWAVASVAIVIVFGACTAPDLTFEPAAAGGSGGAAATTVVSTASASSSGSAVSSSSMMTCPLGETLCNGKCEPVTTSNGCGDGSCAPCFGGSTEPNVVCSGSACAC